ncbi:MAG: peptidylprolyl isomerase [Candidatus Hydrothermales bacterium]
MLKIFLILIFLQIKIERLLNRNSTPEERVKTAIQFKDKEIKLSSKIKANIKTSKGEVICELYPQYAPKTVTNFVKLSSLGFYDGLKFHRYVPGFVIQGGDPYGTGYGNAGYTIPLETHPKAKHVEGALGMARAADPNSGSCQFYITLSQTPHLDGNYTVFGKVIKGMDVVKKLRQGDIIEKIVIFESK